jgi:dihydrodipicolinate synthase/N-acetylneuraminate lyase
MSLSEQSKNSFRGVVLAIAAPLDAGGECASAPLERLLESLHEIAVHGVYLCGQAGEGFLQSVGMRPRVAAVAGKSSPSCAA